MSKSRQVLKEEGSRRTVVLYSTQKRGEGRSEERVEEQNSEMMAGDKKEEARRDLTVALIKEEVRTNRASRRALCVSRPHIELQIFGNQTITARLLM